MAPTLICIGFLVAVLGVHLWRASRPRDTTLANAARRRELDGTWSTSAADARAADRPLRAFVVLSGLLVCCGFAAWIGAWLLPQMILDDRPFWLWTWVGGLALGVLYLGWSAWRLRGSPHRGLALTLALLFGVPGCVGMAGTAITAIDVLADRSEPQLIVANKASIRAAIISRKGGGWHAYYVSFESDDNRLPARTRLEIDAVTYRKLRARWNGLEGDDLVIAWHPGVLGIPWAAVRN